MEWYFRPLAPGETTRDPIIGEFFSTEAIDNPAEALVREGIQNALDASENGSVRIRIFLSGNEHALSPGIAVRWIDGTWKHVESEGNGLRKPPSRFEPCPFLVFEDFGTTGLKGDEAQKFDKRGVKNSFFYFFRAEGRSAKSEHERGRWGVGKHVFPRSSRISTFFGLTMRADDAKRLLMGHSILKSHCVDGIDYSPDGHFGKRPDDLVLPVSDVDMLDQFCIDFHIKRKNEPGLSIVVPYVDPEITTAHLREAVVTGYFYPIVTGMLVVTIETPDGDIQIDSETLKDVARELGDEKSKEALPVIELAKWAVNLRDEDVLRLNPCSPTRPDWSDDLIPFDLSQVMRDKLSKGDRLAIRATLTVREKRKPACSSYFTIYLQQDGYESGRPIFVREGVIISDVRAQRTPRVRSLVTVEDKPLAMLLGDSENPAHTQWQKHSSNFDGKYTYGEVHIEFVTKAVARIVQALGAKEEQEDKNLLLDIFALPPEKPQDDPKRPQEKTKSEPGKDSEGDTTSQEPRKKRFKVLKVPGGFTVTNGDQGTTPPAWLDIKCAYDTRRGNPLTGYDTALRAKAPDFKIGEGRVRVIEKVGVKVQSQVNNYLRIKIVNPEFQIQVKGFDQNRDLFASVKIVEGNDD